MWVFNKEWISSKLIWETHKKVNPIIPIVTKKASQNPELFSEWALGCGIGI